MIVYISSTIFLYIFYNCYEYKNKKKNKDYNNPGSNTKLNNIVSDRYVIVNKTKSYILGALTPLAYYYAMIFLYNFDSHNKIILDFIGGVYAATDLSAMFYNRQCHMSTWIHHIIVQLLYLYCYLNNYDMETSLCKPICVYCCFSSMAYIVNYRVAIRYSNHRYEQIINDLSFVIYFVTCAINWYCQLGYLYSHNTNSYEKIIYVGVLLLIINDDIYLMRYLKSTFNLKKYEFMELKVHNKIKILINKLLKKNKNKLPDLSYYRYYSN